VQVPLCSYLSSWEYIQGGKWVSWITINNHGSVVKGMGLWREATYTFSCTLLLLGGCSIGLFKTFLWSSDKQVWSKNHVHALRHVLCLKLCWYNRRPHKNDSSHLITCITVSLVHNQNISLFTQTLSCNKIAYWVHNKTYYHFRNHTFWHISQISFHWLINDSIIWWDIFTWHWVVMTC